VNFDICKDSPLKRSKNAKSGKLAN